MASFAKLRIALIASTAIVSFSGVSHAQTTTTEKTTISTPVTDPAAKADPDMAKVLTALDELHPKPIESLAPSEARKQPSATDAVMKVIKDEKLKVDPHAGLSVSNSRFADMGNLKLRYYTPEKATKDSGLPVIVYYRGGGWVIADLDTYDASASAIARKANAIVVSVDYPMAPEHKFPAQHDEAIEAYKYILKNAKGWGGDPAKVAIVGESAGGNLAVATAIAARDQKLTAPVAVISVYPIATTAADTPSKREQAAAKPLNAPMMVWFFDKVLNNEGEKQDPRLNLVGADLKGLPPTTIINAEIDPLRSDGDMLADKMKAAGNDVRHKVYNGVSHEFFGMDSVVAKAKEAQDFAVAQLLKSFGTSPGTVDSSPSK